MMQKRTSIRLFENPYLERLSHVHPATPIVLWGPLVAYLFWRALAVDHIGLAPFAAVFLIGVLAWTFVEYVLHRWIFHFKPHGPFQERIAYLIHGIHHDDPADATRLVMPPVAAIFLAIVIGGSFRLMLGPVWFEPFFGSFIIGYLCYDYIHYYVHHFNPRTLVGKKLKQNHMLHHFAEDGALWGVSSPLWDYVFRTAKVERRRRAQTA